MIRILSLNPSLDRVMDVPEFARGQIIRANSCTTLASGKGVNSAFAAAAIDVHSYIYAIVGKNDFLKFSQLHPLITSDILVVPGSTRMNVTISQDKIHLICHIQADSPNISHSSAVSLAERFVKGVADGDVAVISGSVPAGVKPTLLAEILENVSKTKAKIVVDVDPSYWPHINWSVVHWAKPNLEELSRYIGQPLEFEPDIYREVLKCRLAARTVVSLGARGAILISREKPGWILGQTHTAFSHTTLPVGCGDAMVGGFAAALSRGESDDNVLKYGISAGCANLAGTAPGRIDRKIFDQALKSANLIKNNKP